MDLKYKSVQEIEREIKCPYCGHEWADSHEVGIDEDEEQVLDCPECSKKFTAEKCISIDYRTSKDCELNGEAHDYETSFYADDMDVCKKCSMNRSKPRPSTGGKGER